MTESEQGLTLPGTPFLNGNDSWRPHVEPFLSKVGIAPVQVVGIARLDRWYIPGSNRMGMHSVHVVTVRPEMKTIIIEVTKIKHYVRLVTFMYSLRILLETF